MNTRSKIVDFLKNGPISQLVDTFNDLLDVINVKFDKEVAIDDFRGIIINKFNAYIFDFLRGIEPISSELITKARLLKESEENRALNILKKEALDIAASYLIDSKIGGFNDDGLQSNAKTKTGNDQVETGIRAVQTIGEDTPGGQVTIEDEQIFEKDKKPNRSSIEYLRHSNIIRRSVGSKTFHDYIEHFQSKFAEGDVTTRETLNLIRLYQQYAKVDASFQKGMRPGLHVIYGRTNVGKSKKLYEIYSELLKRNVNTSFIYASEPHPFSVGSAKDAIDMILMKLMSGKSTGSSYYNKVFIVDSLRDIIYLPGGLAAGGVSTMSYELMTTLSAMCMATNTTIVTAINPTSDDDKVYNSLMHAITSSVTSLTEITSNSERTTFRKIVTNHLSYIDHYERNESLDIMSMLTSGNDRTFISPDQNLNDKSTFCVRAQERFSFLGA